MLDADANTLLNVTGTNRLVNDDAEGTLRDVEDNTSLAMVELVGHTLLDGTIGLDIDQITDLVGLHVGGKLDHPMITEGTGEEMASTGTVTEGVRHSFERRR